MADAKAVSNYLVELAQGEGNTLTPMQVLKLAYIAHGFHLGEHGTPLISNRIEAWKFGPVIPDLYHAIKQWGSKPVGNIHVPPEGEFENDNQKEIVKIVYDSYGKLDGIALSNLTHRPGSPWSQVYDPRISNRTIPDDVIQNHYREMLQVA